MKKAINAWLYSKKRDWKKGLVLIDRYAKDKRKFRKLLILGECKESKALLLTILTRLVA